MIFIALNLNFIYVQLNNPLIVNNNLLVFLQLHLKEKTNCIFSQFKKVIKILLVHLGHINFVTCCNL